MRQSLTGLMTPESAERFLRFEIIKAGRTVAHFRTREEADEETAEFGPTARVEGKSMRLSFSAPIRLAADRKSRQSNAQRGP
jgi:hypothetical protein